MLPKYLKEINDNILNNIWKGQKADYKYMFEYAAFFFNRKRYDDHVNKYDRNLFRFVTSPLPSAYCDESRKISNELTWFKVNFTENENALIKDWERLASVGINGKNQETYYSEDDTFLQMRIGNFVYSSNKRKPNLTEFKNAVKAYLLKALTEAEYSEGKFKYTEEEIKHVEEFCTYFMKKIDEYFQEYTYLKLGSKLKLNHNYISSFVQRQDSFRNNWFTANGPLLTNVLQLWKKTLSQIKANSLTTNDLEYFDQEINPLNKKSRKWRSKNKLVLCIDKNNNLKALFSFANDGTIYSSALIPNNIFDIMENPKLTKLTKSYKIKYYIGIHLEQLIDLDDRSFTKIYKNENERRETENASRRFENNKRYKENNNYSKHKIELNETLSKAKNVLHKVEKYLDERNKHLLKNSELNIYDQTNINELTKFTNTLNYWSTLNQLITNNKPDTIYGILTLNQKLNEKISVMNKNLRDELIQ